MESIWSKSVKIPEKQVCPSDKKVDVAVIGAGMAGILTAYLLQERGVEVIVIEADRIAGGQTKNTTAKITSQHGMRYEELIRKYGHEKARLYAAANREAINRYQEIIEKHKIACDFDKPWKSNGTENYFCNALSDCEYSGVLFSEAASREELCGGVLRCGGVKRNVL